MKRILVTGGGGFLGSHLVDRLAEQGHLIYVIDDFSTGRRDSLVERPRVHVFPCDVRNPRLDLQVPTKVDEIYNLACPASPLHYQADPIKTLQTNFIGTMNVLELARRWGAKVLQASTSEIYGDPLRHPQNESYWGNVNTVGPRSCYDEGKRAAETLCYDYRRQYGVATTIVRIFNTYGPRMGSGDGRVVSSFIAAALTGAPLQVHGDGSQMRSFCYVDDTIDGLMRAMACGGAGPINIGGTDEITIGMLAIEIEKQCGRFGACWESLPPAIDDPRRRNPDITLAWRALGWVPKVSLEEGLRRTIEWFRAHDLSHHPAVAVPA